MDLAAVMAEVGEALGTIADLRVYAYPPDSLLPPAAVVSWPDTVTFDETYGRGMDRMTLPVVVMVGRPSDRSTAERLGAYANGSGASSVKQAVEAHTYTTCDTVRVVSAEFDVVAVAGNDYMAALFDLDIAGKGA